jgi:DNA-directed RNA polymerase subunit L
MPHMVVRQYKSISGKSLRLVNTVLLRQPGANVASFAIEHPGLAPDCLHIIIKCYELK